MAEQPVSSEQIANRKYIGPNKTGDNIDADRVALYGFSSAGDSTWHRLQVDNNGVVQTSGSGGGGGAVTVADGADVTQGAIADAAVTAGNTGTVSGKLRQISSDISTGNTAQATAANQTTMNTNLSTIVTNTGNGSTSANQTNGTQQAKITDGTNIASTLKSDGTAAGQNSLLTGSAYLSVPFTTTTVQAVGSTDVGNYRWVSAHFTTQGGSASCVFQGSNDNVNWVNVLLSNITASSSQVAFNTTTNSANSLWSGALNTRYFRINVTGIVSGTTAGTIVFSANPTGMSAMSVTNMSGSNVGVSANQAGTWTVGSNSATGSAVPANAFYIGMNGSSGNLRALNATDSLGDASAGGNMISSSVSAYNGATYDRQRNNVTGAVIAAGATASNAGVNVTTYNASKLVIVVNISAFTSGSLTVTINGTSSSSYTYPLLTSAALAAVAVTPLRIFPGATASANAVANDMVPRTVQVVTTVSGTLTYGIDYELGV